MYYSELVKNIADILKDFDQENPKHKDFQIIRPYGDNGKEAENWTVNLLHPYPGNVSLIGDAIKLLQIPEYNHKGLFVIGYEHDPAKISLDPLICSFEKITREVLSIRLGDRVEERQTQLVHPEHQVVRCIGWELFTSDI